MPNYILSPAAQRDLSDIWDYTVDVWGENQAERYTRDIQRACEGLATGQTTSRDAESIRPGYRRAKVGQHVIFYKLTDDAIDVVRILHGRMDIPTQLK